MVSARLGNSLSTRTLLNFLYRLSEKDCTLFNFCPVCGEWCKLQWLLLDTPTFDWNTRRSRGHKSFKMASNKLQGPKENFLKKVQSFSDILYIHSKTLLKTHAPSIRNKQPCYLGCPVEAATFQSSHLLAVQASGPTPISTNFSVVTQRRLQ
jgi:hypothetical protein